MSKNKLLREIKKSTEKVRGVLVQEALASRFLIGSHNAVRLKKSLAAAGRFDLMDRTLLAKQVHKTHSAKLAARYVTKWKKLRDLENQKWSKLPLSVRKSLSKPTDETIAGSRFRFLTLVDSVSLVDAAEALKAAKKMKADIEAACTQSKGIGCLGAIEVEVVSIGMMREIRDKDNSSASERRKLDVCEVLAEELKSSLYQDESSLFLIHFHGVITATRADQFDAFSEELHRCKRWTRAPRQIELKKLSTHFAGKPKSTAQNLKHIAQYVTKGGNDWMAEKAYLRYKIGFENDDPTIVDERTWVAQNWRRNSVLKREHADEGIIDSLSLTAQEIVQLTLVIDGLMSLNRTRTGYLISTGF
jgi:hypothetical protein